MVPFPAPRTIIGRFSQFPREVTRAQNGNVRMRLKAPEKTSYDVVVTSGGRVPAAVQKGTLVLEPNGMSMRSPELSKDLVEGYSGSSVRVYTIPQQTPVPNGLVLLLDDRNHFSLQPEQEMTKGQFDSMLQQFLNDLPCETKEAWIARNTGGSSSSQGTQSSSSKGKKSSSPKAKRSSSEKPSHRRHRK